LLSIVAHVSASHAPTLLVVDYDVARLARTRALLEGEGHVVGVARDSAMAASAADASIGVLLLADEMQLERARGLVGTLRSRGPALQLVLLASERSGGLARETLERLGVHSYVSDADGPERLLQAVEAAMRAHRALAEAQASDRLKMELLASVSHEFRSPLHIILGYLELVREGAFGSLSTGLADALGKVAWNAGQLLELVEDFLDLVKLETSAVAAERVDVGALVRALVGDNELLIHGRPLTLRAHVEGRLPPVVADGAKLRVILQNLLTNALKFTAEGEIVVSASSPDPRRVQIAVRDTGPGIPAGDRERVFDLFQQLQPGDMRRKGIGLGLALARRFARAMHGELVLESEVGLGSTFTLTLPACPDAADAAGVVIRG
jgi:signal transduction histidine kinase